MSLLSKRARRFQHHLDERGLNLRVVELPESSRTADEAAAALGCDKAQIVKSLVFRNERTDEPVLVLASGHHHVDEARLAEHVAAPIARADAKFVKARTGYSIGGVAPLGHKEPCLAMVDRELMTFEVVWAAAGTPHAVFEIDRPITEILNEYRLIDI